MPKLVEHILTSSMLSFVRCRFTLDFHRANVKRLSVNTRPRMNDSGDRFALARSRLSSRHGAAPRETITTHRLSDLVSGRCPPLPKLKSRHFPGGYEINGLLGVHHRELLSAIDGLVLDLDLQVAFDQLAELAVLGWVI